MPDEYTGRGAQVVFASLGAQRASRGGYGRTMAENVARKEALEAEGEASDGNTVNGTTRTGLHPFDVVYGRYYGDAVLVTMDNLPTSPDGLPPGTLWKNGGFVCVA